MKEFAQSWVVVPLLGVAFALRHRYQRSAQLDSYWRSWLGRPRIAWPRLAMFLLAFSEGALVGFVGVIAARLAKVPREVGWLLPILGSAAVLGVARKVAGKFVVLSEDGHRGHEWWPKIVAKGIRWNIDRCSDRAGRVVGWRLMVVRTKRPAVSLAENLQANGQTATRDRERVRRALAELSAARGKQQADTARAALVGTCVDAIRSGHVTWERVDAFLAPDPDNRVYAAGAVPDGNGTERRRTKEHVTRRRRALAFA